MSEVVMASPRQRPEKFFRFFPDLQHEVKAFEARSPLPETQAQHSEIYQLLKFRPNYPPIFSDNPSYFQGRGGASRVHFRAKPAYCHALTGNQRSK
jgi:hypothetical protein